MVQPPCAARWRQGGLTLWFRPPVRLLGFGLPLVVAVARDALRGLSSRRAVRSSGALVAALLVGSSRLCRLRSLRLPLRGFGLLDTGSS